MKLKATMEIAWLAVDMGIDQCSIVLRDYGFLRSDGFNGDVGYVDVGYFLERKGKGLPNTIWFTSEFLAYLAGDGNCANIIDDEGNLAPVGSCQWQQFFDPPPSEWPIEKPSELREFVHAKYQGQQYVWELVECCAKACHFKGVWKD